MISRGQLNGTSFSANNAAMGHLKVLQNSKTCIPYSVFSGHDRQRSGPQGGCCEPLDPDCRFTPMELRSYSSDLASQSDEPTHVVSSLMVHEYAVRIFTGAPEQMPVGPLAFAKAYDVHYIRPPNVGRRAHQHALRGRIIRHRSRAHLLTRGPVTSRPGHYQD